MKSPVTNPVHWRLDTLLSFDGDEVHELARVAAGTLTSYRLVLGRCLLAIHHNKAYRRYGCSSAIHYASSVLGLNPKEACACRRVARELRGLPELTLAAEQGNIAWSKLREIVRKASPETETFWLKLAESRSYNEIQALVRRTPKGALPGDVDHEEPTISSELRCQLSDEVFALLSQARRTFSLEKGEAATTAEVLEWALTSFIASQPADADILEKVRAASNKDVQAEKARDIPLVNEARELAQGMGLLDESEQPSEDVSPEPDPLSAALGAAPLADCQPNRPARAEQPLYAWQNKRLRFNPRARNTTPGQKKEILRRDGWCCQTPGCPNKVWLHLHHLKPYSQGGPTQPENLLCLCSRCHKNHHRGVLNITADSSGKPIFRDQEERRLDQQAKLELASWLDFWLGWKGRKTDSRTRRAHAGCWDAVI